MLTLLFSMIPAACDDPLMTSTHLVTHANTTPFLWPLFPVITP